MNRYLDRRDVLIGAGALALSGSAAARAAEARTITMAHGWINNIQHAGYWIAVEKGYFAAEGIDARHIQGGPNAPQPLITVAAGKADLGSANWLPFLDAVGQGNDFVVIAANFPISAAGLISLPSKPIVKPADLVKARILAQGPNEKTTIEATLGLAGLPIDYTFIPAGFSPEPLLAKQGDAYFCFVTNQPITLERMGLKAGSDFIVTRFEELGYRVPTTLFFAPRAMIERDRKLLVGYLRALIRGWLDNEKDPSYAAHLVIDKYGKDLGLDLNQQIRQNELQLPLTRAPGEPRLFVIPAEQVGGAMYAAARAAGRTNLPEPGRVVDMSLLAEAHAGLKT
jgi:ABC-type nitrate/sulfonate/bicarbonate transport system substrate-binding protein